MKVKSVHIEGFHNTVDATYNFEDSTYLYGPNGSGKSTVLQAIQLALLGYVPGTNKNSKEALFKHANNKLMSVKVVVDAGSYDISVRRSWLGSKSSIASTVEIEPEGYPIENLISDIELPIFNFNEFIGMTANKLKDWFVNFLPNEDIDIDWRSELLGALDGKISTISDPTLLDSTLQTIQSYPQTGVDLVRQVNQYFKQALSFKKQELARLQGTVQSLIFYDDYVEEYTLDELDAMIRDTQDILMKTSEYERIMKINEEINNELTKYSQLSESLESDESYRFYVNQLNGLQTTKQQYAEDFKKMQTQLSEYSTKLASMRTILDRAGVCPYTEQKCDHINELIVSVQKEYTTVEKNISELQAKIDEQRNRYNDINTSVADVNDKVQLLVSQYQDRDRLLSKLVEVPTDIISGLMKEEIVSRLDKLNESKAKSIANHRYNSMIDKFTSDKFIIEQTIQVYKIWDGLTGVNGLQSSSDAASPFIRFSNSIDPFVQIMFDSNTHARFNIEGKANSFSIGIARNGKYIPFDLLSSGEKCLYTVALMLGIVNAGSSELKLLLVDDLFDHLDDMKFHDLVTALNSVSNIQTIFAGVKQPDDSMKHVIFMDQEVV